MFSPRIWLVITLVLLLTLCLLVIWMFSDLELVFPGGERVDRSVRKRLGASVLIVTGLEIAVGFVIFFNVDSLRYWAGAGCIVVGLVFVFGAIRCVFAKQVWEKSDARDGLAKEIALAEKSLALYRAQKARHPGTRLMEVLLVVFLYFYLSGSGYLSLFDLFGLVFFMTSTEVKFVADGIAIKRRLVFLGAEQAKAV